MEYRIRNYDMQRMYGLNSRNRAGYFSQQDYQSLMRYSMRETPKGDYKEK